MLLFGTEGYLFNKPDLTHTQFILAMILGSMLKGDFTEIPPPVRSLMIFHAESNISVNVLSSSFFPVAH